MRPYFQDPIETLQEYIRFCHTKLESRFIESESPLAERIKEKIKIFTEAVEVLKKEKK